MAGAKKPQYTHDCRQCIFLGRWRGVAHSWALKHGKASEEDYDLYVCLNPNHPNLDSWLCRYGNQGHEYLSSHPSAAFAQPYKQQPWEAEIEKRIKERKIR